MKAPKPEILLIDDEKDKLESLAIQVRNNVDTAIVQTWHPRRNEDPSQEFEKRISKDTILVVTDYDLTTAIKGLFGHSVVAWCRNQFIPVGDFSRGHDDALSTEPDLFKLRVPRNEPEAADYIARMFDGFRRIRDGIESNTQLLGGGGSPAYVLSELLGRPDLESEISPYLSRPGLFNASLLDTLVAGSCQYSSETEKDKEKLLTYILGHVLVNAILKYPGPVLAEGPLCAYMGMSNKDSIKLTSHFQNAKYDGPFDSNENLFWRDKVDDEVEKIARRFRIEDLNYESLSEYRRAVMIEAIGPIANHSCARCDGVKGGFWCPFTKRVVCERGDCSSTASSWIPSGAYACRVERDFYDEWSPILGL